MHQETPTTAGPKPSASAATSEAAAPAPSASSAAPAVGPFDCPTQAEAAAAVRLAASELKALVAANGPLDDGDATGTNFTCRYGPRVILAVGRWSKPEGATRDLQVDRGAAQGLGGTVTDAKLGDESFITVDDNSATLGVRVGSDYVRATASSW